MGWMDAVRYADRGMRMREGWVGRVRRVVAVLGGLVSCGPDFAIFFGTTRRPAFAVIGRITL